MKKRGQSSSRKRKSASPPAKARSGAKPAARKRISRTSGKRSSPAGKAPPAAVIGRAAELQRDVQGDIHELKQEQDSLLKERNLISAILDAAKDLLVVVSDREGRIVRFNRACQRLTGYSFEEVKGRRPWDFLMAADETPAARETFSKVLGGEPSQSENHWVAKDGRRILVSWSFSPAVSDGSVESVIATGMDRSWCEETLQRAEEDESTIRALLETAAQAIVEVNQQGRIGLVNAATERMFGYSRDELIGQPVEKLLPERIRARHLEIRTSWFSQPRNRPKGIGVELTGLRKDGTEFPVEIGLSYIDSHNGVQAVAFVSDVTERKISEATLVGYQKDLQRLAASLLSAQETGNRELSRELHDVFSQELAGLGMEVSSLLQSVEGAGPLKERLTDLVRKIGRLANEMHRTSRQLHPAILDELGLEAAMREECGNFSEQCGIPVRFTSRNLPAQLPEEVSLCLYRVTQESLRNVRKHTGATEVRVRLNGVEGGVSLRVNDTGGGFDVNEARKRGGLGLISMEERVRAVNGKFSIHSQPGSGTTVEVFVPLGGNGS